ncbi:uncharacterized protein C1683.06c-like isoform X4 [Ostrinia furnacalis]|uniref:uncharacterized protein C1683.06c-like isoform X4 n=1 Tax=Ostrinia furnacalis TaxID=93504 RepID=UPI00103C2404|nr:uncharacterized protein C1683.06c-like isoform X4 [Ostrinia furnacalis]
MKRKMYQRIVLICFIFCGSFQTCLCTDSIKNEGLKLVIDNDAGGDDAIAIFEAILYEKYFNGPKLVALTTGNGNTFEDNVVVNNQKVLKVAGRQDIPIYRGARSSLVHTPATNAYYGVDGLGDTGENFTDLGPVQEENAIMRLIELSKMHEGRLIIVTIGTLTNIALAIKIDAQFLNRLSQLYIAAGHIHSDIHPQPEFNALMDVEAYHIVVKNATPDKVTVVPFSQTQIFLNYTRTWRQETLGAIDSEVVRAMNKYEQVSLRRPGSRWQSLDPSAVAAAIKTELVNEYKYSQNDIILCGDKRGLNTNKIVDKEHANVRMIYSMKDAEYQQFLLDLFRRK